jgi:hypothetical protein
VIRAILRRSGTSWGWPAITLVLLVPEFGGPVIGGFAWLYPLVQPAARALVAVWLWREAGSPA